MQWDGCGVPSFSKQESQRSFQSDNLESRIRIEKTVDRPATDSGTSCERVGRMIYVFGRRMVIADLSDGQYSLLRFPRKKSSCKEKSHQDYAVSPCPYIHYLQTNRPSMTVRSCV